METTISQESTSSFVNPPELTPEAFYQVTHGKYIVENATVYKTLDEFFETEKIDFKVASSGVAGGSYNLSRIPEHPCSTVE